MTWHRLAHCWPLTVWLLWTSPSIASDEKAKAGGMVPPKMDMQGKKFSSGTKVDQVLPNVSFEVPSNWDAVEPDGEGIVVLGSKNSTAIGWAFVAIQSEVRDSEKLLNEPVPIMHHILNPSAQAWREGRVWRNTFEDAEDPNYLGWGLALPIKHTGNLFYFLVCDSVVKTHCEQAISQLLRTTQILDSNRK